MTNERSFKVGRRKQRAQLEARYHRVLPDGTRKPWGLAPWGGQFMRVDRDANAKAQILQRVQKEIAKLEDEVKPKTEGPVL